jgi:hypothetical protein
LTPDTTYALGQEAQLVTTVVGQTGVVLVAWEHKAIARALLPAIANGQTLPGMPTKRDFSCSWIRQLNMVMKQCSYSSVDAEWKEEPFVVATANGTATIQPDTFNLLHLALSQSQRKTERRSGRLFRFDRTTDFQPPADG